MRVIAGAAGGRRLEAPRGHRVRPTPDRVREALFSALGSKVGGASVLDLYAGSGALGIEALSRGAGRVVFVERDSQNAALIARNLSNVDLPGGTVRSTDAARFCRSAADGPFDIVLADPPYDVSLSAIIEILTDLHRGGALAPGAIVVIERRNGSQKLPDCDGGVAWQRSRAYGDTVLLWGQAKEGGS